jgi:hypothetical protein
MTIQYLPKALKEVDLPISEGVILIHIGAINSAIGLCLSTERIHDSLHFKTISETRRAVNSLEQQKLIYKARKDIRSKGIPALYSLSPKGVKVFAKIKELLDGYEVEGTAI